MQRIQKVNRYKRTMKTKQYLSGEIIRKIFLLCFQGSYLVFLQNFFDEIMGKTKQIV
jgi:hypothetical protein